MKRRILSILAALALCLGLLPVLALAEETSGTCGENLTWTLSDDGTLTISYTGEGTGAMENYPFGAPWLSERISIKSVVIQNGVTSIGIMAFDSLDYVTSVEIPATVTSIGRRAFSGCNKLNSVNLPAGLTSIEMQTFLNCRALTSIEIPDSVRTIGGDAFNTTGLTKVTIPEGVTSIGSYAFANSTSLTTVEIPASVGTIGEGAFQGSTNAKILFKGTQDQWESAGGAKSGASEDKLVINPHEVTIMGGGDRASGSGTYGEGASVSIFAGTKDGYAFTGWTVSPGGTDLGRGFYPKEPETGFKMPGHDITLTATWAEAVAEVGGRNFADLQTAFGYATDPTYIGDTVTTLLKDVTVDQPITLSEGEVTLTGGGEYTLTGTGSATISVKGGSLTLEDVTVKNTSEGLVVSPEYVIPGTAIHVEGSGNLTVSDGSAVRAEGKDGWALYYLGGQAHITIQGGTISGGEGFGFNTTGDFTADKISLLGGTFIGRTGNAIYAPGGFTLGNLVGEGLALINDNTKEAVALTEEYTGPGTFTVGCAHASVGAVTSSAPNENGVVTVTGTCQKCGETVTLGTLTMVGSGQTIIFGQAAQPFSVQASEGLTIVSYSWNNGTSTNTQYQPSVSTSGELKCPCEVTFKTPDNQEATANLEFTLTVRRLDITNAALTVGLVPDTSFSVPYNGQEQAPDVAKVLIDGEEFKYTLFGITLVDASGSEAAKQTNAGTYKIKLTGQDPLTGTQTLTSPVFTIEKAPPAIEWKSTMKEMTYKGQEPDLDNELTVTLVNGETYNKDVNGAIAYSYATAENGDYTNGLPKNAGTYYIKASLPAKGNYTNADASGTLKLTITKATPKLTLPTAKDLTYDGTAQELVNQGSTDVGAPVLYALAKSAPGGTPVYHYSTTIPTATDAGAYNVYYKVEETENYSGVNVDGTAFVQAKIGQATADDIAGQVMYIQNHKEAEYTLDLNQFAPAPPFGHFGAEGEDPAQIDKPSCSGLTCEIKVSGYFENTDVHSDSGILTIHVKDVDTTDEQDVAVITVSYTSYNFKPIEMKLTIKAVNKTPVTITGVEAAGWTYDGTAHNGYTGTPSAGAYTGDLDVAYYKQDGTKLDAVPKDAGTYTVTFSVPDSADYVGSKDLTFTVEPATVTVRADDKTATVGAARPELTWRVVSGLADGETLKTAPGLVCDADMSKAGTYPITISGGEVPDGGNYKAQIVYQDGTLTVRSSGGGHSHRWAEEWSSDSARHWHRCLNGCSQRRDLADHVFDDEWDAECNVCGYVREAAHRHVWAGKWSSDGTHHWHECTAEGCGVTDNRQKDSYGEHVYDNSRDAVCNVCGYVRKVDRPSGGGSGGSGGGTSVTSYRVTVEESEHGRVVSDCASAASGRTVTLTVTPDDGYALDTLTVTGSRGRGISLTGKDGKYTFAMPDEVVTVRGVFTLLPDDPEKECDGGADCPSHSFTDLGGVGTWYHEAVDYVLRNGLMNGYSAGFFGPDNRLTRAQLVQILYNHAGRPAAAGGGGFTDVTADAWCAPAIAWATERGIAGGYGNGTFGPDDAITREQLAVMLWRYAGSPAAGQELSFHDAGKIGAHAREAICWAVESGVMSGKGGGVLDPKGLATRAQTAQMLKNFLENG